MLPVFFTITRGPNRLVVQSPLISYVDTNRGLTACTVTGDYVQYGHFGKSQGTFGCADGSRGTHTFSEMATHRVGWAKFQAWY